MGREDDNSTVQNFDESVGPPEPSLSFSQPGGSTDLSEKVEETVSDSEFCQLEHQFWWGDQRFVHLSPSTKIVYISLWSQAVLRRSESFCQGSVEWSSLVRSMAVLAGIRPQNIRSCINSLIACGLCEESVEQSWEGRKGPVKVLWVPGAERKHLRLNGWREGEKKREEKQEKRDVLSPPPAEEETEQRILDANAKKRYSLECDVNELVDVWNSLPPPIPRVQKLTAKRKKAAMARMAETGWYDDAIKGLQLIETDPFYRGSGNRGWVATFDWFIRPDTVQKLVERREAREAMP